MTDKYPIIFSESRYNGGVRVKREFGSATVTVFKIKLTPESEYLTIEGKGRTPGDRRTAALNAARAKAALATP